MNELLLKYIDYCRYERAFSALTCESYAADCQRFFDYLKKHDISDKTILPIHIQQWLMTTHGEGKSPRTLARALAALRGFFKFCINHQFLTLNPADGIKVPKETKSLPKTLDVDQIQALLDSPTLSDIEYRDLVILELFYSSGLRLSELVSANINDFDFKAGLLRVTGKGKKTRIVPVGTKAMDALQRWMKTRALWNPEHDAMFITQQGRRLGARAVQKRVALFGQKHGLSVPLHPHQLRHSVASHLLESSQDLRSVQEFLGHANLSTTQIYTALDFQHLAQVYDQAHPRAKKK
ncbi:MAG: tyrosine recombinase XerC [Gammaproteobacteria bacterium]